MSSQKSYILAVHAKDKTGKKGKNKNGCKNQTFI